MRLDTAKGAAAYTRTSLAVYDLFVLGFSNSFAWKCPSRVILEFNNRHVSDRHLDVGIGTGYFLAKMLSGLYNRKGIFSNREDALPDLEEGLRYHCLTGTES